MRAAQPVVSGLTNEEEGKLRAALDELQRHTEAPDGNGGRCSRAGGLAGRLDWNA